jgi:outer membrane protein OmpA-like peptidoglycan-associated protein
MYKITSFLLLMFMVHCSLSGQKIVPTAKDLYADAMEYVISGDYHEALYLLLELEDRGFKSVSLDYKIGECYLNIPGQKTQAIPYLRNAVTSISEAYKGDSIQESVAPPKALLYLGIAFRLKYDFDNALIYLNQYRNHLAETDKDNIHLAEYHIERCNNARELIAAPAIIRTDTLNRQINNMSSNYNPLVTLDEKLIYFNQEFKFYDAVMRSVKIDSIWTAPENLTGEVKSDGDHYLTGLSANGTELFFTFYDPYRTGDIYTSSFADGIWTSLTRLEEPVNTQFNETHASLSPDGEDLYFTSDRKSGYGGMDIYQAHRMNGQWQNPVNLGPIVNTPYNEETPFVSSDGSILFFSSQGHYNMGGYDIFYCKKDREGNWLPPVNLGYPLNTTDDDLFYFPLDTGNVAYQSRFLQNSPERNIVKFTVLKYGKPARFNITGKMDIQADSGFQANAIDVAFIQNNRDTIAHQALNKDGSFSQKLTSGSYQVRFENGNSEILTKKISIPEYFPHNSLIMQDRLVIRTPVKFDSIYLKDIRFEFNRVSIEAQFLPVLDAVAKIMDQYPEVRVQINGYADAIGRESYNMKLSMDRAIVVKEYLASKTGSTKQIEVKAFGEQNPVALNSDANGNDVPEGRKYNRRAEVVFVNVPESLIVIKVNDIPQTFIQK